MTRLCLALFLLAPLFAQEQKKPETPAPQGTKVIILKYADPNRVANLLQILGCCIRADSDLHALVVSTSPSGMAAIEDAVKRLDVPESASQDFELTAYYVVGATDENPAAGAQPLPAVPKDLDSVVAQMRNTFPYKAYHLLDTLVLRTRAGRGAATSGMPSGNPMRGCEATFCLSEFRITSASLGPDGMTIRIDGLHAGVRRLLPATSGSSQSNSVNLGIDTEVDLKEGQKVVVGRVGMDNNQALFLVLTARLAN
jgi:hypothetical protein